MVHRRRRCAARRGGRESPTSPAPATPTCAFRTTAAGGTSRPAASTATPSSMRAAHGRPRRGQRAAGRRRGPDWHYRRGQQRAALQPLGGAGRGELARLLRAAVFRRPGTAAAGRRRRSTQSRPWSDWPRRSRCTPANPLVGLEGRVALLHRLGDALRPARLRPGRRGSSTSRGANRIAAHDILSQVLASLSASIWPAPNSIGADALGRLLAPRRGTRTRPDPRLGAVPQAVAMADLLAAGAVRMGRRACATAWTR